MASCRVTQNLHHAFVITKRRKLVAIIMLAVIGGVISYPLLRESDEPTYQGRRLSEWLELAQNGSNTSDAETAVLKIGTNAVPYLLKWISHEPSAWRMTLRNRLPTFVVKRGFVNRWLNEDTADRRAFYTITGFSFLGTNAQSAIPELETLMKNTKSPNGSVRAIYSLSAIGQSAIPVLKAALADTNRSERMNILYAFQWPPSKKWSTGSFPIMVEALNDADPAVRSLATNVVKNLAPEALTNTVPE